MESEIIKIKISPEFLLTNKTEIQVSGETYGVYSGITQMLRGGPNETSLFTGFTIPILLTQTTIDVGYFSVFDGAISQLNVVTNFVFSSTTGFFSNTELTASISDLLALFFVNIYCSFFIFFIE